MVAAINRDLSHVVLVDKEGDQPVSRPVVSCLAYECAGFSFRRNETMSTHAH